MRLVLKDLNDKPDILEKQSTIDTLNQIASSGNTELIKDSIYKGSYIDSEGKSQSSVRDKLNKYYFNKCAYCEVICKAEIEHYRPKKGVKEDKTHDGYYWLAYEWSNLVPSCRYCNTEGGKGNQFPIMGKRIFKPSFDNLGKLDTNQSVVNSTNLSAEKPYLLHPEIDNPSHFLSFALDEEKIGITMLGLDGDSKRGEKTIKICNLNRNYLKFARKKNVTDIFIKHIDTLFELNDKGFISNENLPKALKIAFEEAEADSQDVTLEYTLLRKFVVSTEQRFQQIIVSQLQPSQKSIVKEAFQAYKNGDL